MNDLVAFLNARLDELEFSNWHEQDCQITKPLAYPPGNAPVFGTTMSCNCPVPQWLLTDVDAKRQLVTGLAKIVVDGDYIDAGELSLAEWALRLLALPYAHLRDYRKEWAP